MLKIEFDPDTEHTFAFVAVSVALCLLLMSIYAPSCRSEKVRAAWDTKPAENGAAK